MDRETKHVLAKANGVWTTFAMDSIAEQLRNLGYKYVAEGIKLHNNSEYPERREYILSKLDLIERFKHRKIGIQTKMYEVGLIEEKLGAEFIASSKHPAVIAENTRLKKQIADAKNGI
jgi:hypothetical protein